MTLVKHIYTTEYLGAAFVVRGWGVCGGSLGEPGDHANGLGEDASVIWSGMVLFFVGCGVGSVAATMAIALVTAGREP